MEGLYLAAGVMALIAMVYIFRSCFAQNDNDHRVSLQEFALDRSLTFTPLDSGSVIRKLSQFPIFRDGRAHRVRNIISGQTPLGEVLVFEHSYLVMRWFVNQTAVILELRRQSTPNFTLRFERALFPDNGGIKFPGRPDFSRRYKLEGEDALALRKLFSEKMLMFFENNLGLSVECTCNYLLVYRENKRFEGKQLDDFMKRCADLSVLFRGDLE